MLSVLTTYGRDSKVIFSVSKDTINIGSASQSSLVDQHKLAGMILDADSAIEVCLIGY